jgi:DNA-binding beta-propeller fold protein YncE
MSLYKRLLFSTHVYKPADGDSFKICETVKCHFSILASPVGFSVLTVAMLYSLFVPASIYSQSEDTPSAFNPDNKCSGYHTSNALDAGIRVGGSPFRLSVDPTTNMVYVVDKFSKKISFLDGVSDRVAKTVTLARIEPISEGFNRSNLHELKSDISIDPVTKLLYIITSDSSLLYALDTDTGSLVSNFTLRGSPFGLSANNTVIYVITSNEDPYSFESIAYVLYQYHGRIADERSLQMMLLTAWMSITLLITEILYT